MAGASHLRRTLRTVAAAGAAVFGLGADADAQTPDSLRRARADTAGAPIFSVEGLVVQVARPTSTGGVSAVEADLDSLEVPPAPTLEQALRAFPLVQVRANSRGETQPALRGSGERQIAILVDGVPITLGWDHRTDLSIVPLTAARQLRLVRGLPSVLAGPNVLAGLIEVEVARGDVEGRIASSAAASVDDVGGRSASGSGGGTALSGMLRFRAGLGHKGRPGVPLPDVPIEPCAAGEGDPCGTAQRALLEGPNGLRLNSDAERFDGFISARYGGTEGPRLSFMASGFTAERGVPPEAHVSDPRFWRYREQRRLLTVATLGAGTALDGAATLSLGADVGRTVIDAYDSAEYRDVVEGESDSDRTLTARLLGERTFGAAALRAAATFADVRHDETLLHSGGGAYRQRLWSVGGEAELRATRQIRASFGLAVDGADTPLSGDKPPLGALRDWGARAGASALLGGSWMAHAAASRRARFPSLRELYSGALGRFEPNPALEAEVLTALEAGFTARLERAELQAVAYAHRLSGAIARTRVDADGASRFKRVNQDEIRAAGLELLALYGGPRLSMSADGTLQRVRLVGAAAGQHVEYQPRFTAGATAEAPIAFGLLGGLEARHVGAQYCVHPNREGMQRLGASTRWNAELRRTVSLGGGAFRRLAGLLALENVTDGVAYDQCGLPQPGRTVRVQLRLN